MSNRITGDVDTFRLEDVYTVDLRLEKEWAFSEVLTGSLSFDIFNLFDEHTTLQRVTDLTGSRGGWVNETMAPRVWRLGFRIGWN